MESTSVDLTSESAGLRGENLDPATLIAAVEAEGDEASVTK